MVDLVLSEAPAFTDHTQSLLFDAFRVLRPDASLRLYEPLDGRTFEVSEKLKGHLTLAGFLTPTLIASPPYIEVRPFLGSLTVSLFSQAVCKKPNWEVGATQKISLKKKIGAQAPVAANSSGWITSGPADLMVYSSSPVLSPPQRYLIPAPVSLSTF